MTDAGQTRAVLAEVRLNWLVVDHYALDARWERTLRSNCDRLMVIDDLADRPHVCDLLLDQSFGHGTADYGGLVPQSCVVLLGPRYALLSDEFAKLRDYSLQRRAEPEIKALLIAMGGVDRSNATGRVLDALRESQLATDIVVKVVMGPSAPWLNEVRAASAHMPCRTDVLRGVQDMAQLMADSDIAIGAAGGTSWERCCLGLPTILLVLARNQDRVARALSASGAAICAGDSLADLSARPQRWCVFLPIRGLCGCFLRRARSCATVRACAGWRARSLRSLMLRSKLHCASAQGAGVTLRSVRLDDCPDLWEWRNDLETRRNSVVAEEIPWSDHLRWFNASVANPDRLIFIGELSGNKCGMVRFDRLHTPRNAWEVSIVISPRLRGKGLGGVALAKACAEMAARHSECVFAAKVRPRNIPSIRMFERCGFSLMADTNDFVHLRRPPVLVANQLPSGTGDAKHN